MAKMTKIVWGRSDPTNPHHNIFFYKRHLFGPSWMQMPIFSSIRLKWWLWRLTKRLHTKKNKKSTNWWGQAKRHTKIRTKAVVAAFSAVFSNFGICRLEVSDDVKSDVALDYVRSDIPAKLGDSKWTVSEWFSTWQATSVLRILWST